jgi:hypothetical protein
MWWSKFDGTKWSPEQQGVGTGTSARPALAVYNNTLYAVWKGVPNDTRIFWSKFDGTKWLPEQMLQGNTSDAPSAAAFNGYLFVAWKGVPGDNKMWWSAFNGSWTPQVAGVGVGTSTGPSLAAYNNHLAAAWKGVPNDNRMFWSQFALGATASNGDQPHAVTLNPSVTFNTAAERSFSDQVFVGMFDGHDADCVPYAAFPGVLTGMVGWGQGMAGSDACMSFIVQQTVDFDTSAIPSANSITHAALTYDEVAAPACPLVEFYTSTCWQSGGGNPEAKPNGCVIVRIASANWKQTGVKGLMPALPDGHPAVKQVSPHEWDVTAALQYRLSPPIGGANPGFGFLLTGSPHSLDELKTLDRTICTSSITNVRLTVTYLVSPPGAFVPPK